LVSEVTGLCLLLYAAVGWYSVRQFTLNWMIDCYALRGCWMVLTAAVRFELRDCLLLLSTSRVSVEFGLWI
jgi:hypothetical protein